MSDCLTPSNLSDYHGRNLDSAGEIRIRQHLESCANCRDAYRRHCDQAAHTIEAPPPRAGAPQGHRVRIGPADDGSFVPQPARSNDPAAHFPRIEGYRILGVLGQGGMGIVYRAVQTNLNRTVALKVLPAIMGAGNPNAVARFRREATAAARLHHTNIIPIHDFGESRDAYYYAMDLIIGQPLNVLIRRMAAVNAPSLSPTRLSEALRAGDTEVTPTAIVESGVRPLVDDSPSTVGSTPSGRGRAYYQQVARWMADAADALHYAHGQGIIHRDIKPANLILSADGRIMVADFGLAKTIEEESVTMTGALLGSLRYVSPEQAMAKRVRVDHRTDIYSLGATMYELLCFQPAFPGTDEKEILGAIIARDPTATRKILSAVPAELETICLKTLEKSPEARYPTARALSEDLHRYINDLPIAAKRPGPVKRIAKFVRRRKAPVIAVTAAVLLAGAALFAWQQTLARRAADAESLAAHAQRHAAEVQQGYESGMFFAGQGKWIAAEEEWQKVLAIEPNHAPTLVGQAWIRLELFKSQRNTPGALRLLEEADELCRHAVELAPVNSEVSAKALAYRGVALRRMNRLDEAIATLHAASDAFARVEGTQRSYLESATWTNLGTVYVVKGDFTNALQWLRRGAEAVGIGKDAYSAAQWRNLAALEVYLGNSDARAHIDKATECNRDDVLAWVIRAWLTMYLTGHVDFVAALRHAMVADALAQERDARAKRILALAHLRTGNPDFSIREAQAALKLEDVPTINHLIIAIAEAKRGQREAAEAALVAADTAWPPQLRSPGGSLPTAETGDLWIESADQWLALRAEAEQLLK